MCVRPFVFFPSQAGRVEAHCRVGLVLDQRGVRCSRWKKVNAFKSGVVMRIYNTSVMQGRTSGREVRERRVEARQRERAYRA